MTLLHNRQPGAGFTAPSDTIPHPEDREPRNRPGRHGVSRWVIPTLMFLSIVWLFIAFTARPSSVDSYIGMTIPESSLSDHVEDRRQELDIPGLAVAVINDGEIVYNETFGFADIEADRPVTAETIFEGASLSKPVFAHFVMTFVEEGRLDLDRPLHEYLPHPAVLPILFEPGTGYEYSGEGYQYLAMVLAEITNTDWAGLEALFQERVAAPLGLDRMVFIQDATTRGAKAEPYDEDGVKIDWRSDATVAAHEEIFIAGASLHADATDFSRWMIGVMDRELLSAESYEQLLASHATPPAEQINGSYTLGFYRPEIPLTDLYGHTGNNDGFTSFFMLDAEDDWGMIVFTNSEYGQEFGEELFFYLLTGPSIPSLIAALVAAAFLLLSSLVLAVRAIRRQLRTA